MVHNKKHPLADKMVRLVNAEDPFRRIVVEGEIFRVEDWADRLNPNGESIWDTQGNYAISHYAMRAGATGLPVDNDVVYGHIKNKDGFWLGHIVHSSELGDEIS